MLLLEPDGNHLIPNKMKSKVMDEFYWFHITK